MKKKEKVIAWIIFILFVLLIFVLALHHENWRDEAQAYLLCRDMNLLGIFKNVHYEGHPIFYYLFLYPLVKLGVGPKSVNILSFIFMSIAVYLVLFKSKLNLIQKICIIVSYPVLYEFSIVGRSYSLIFLLLIIWALIYPNRKDRPIPYAIVLGCLLNTHLLMLGFVGINALLFYGEEIIKKKTKDKKIWISLIILILFGLIFFIQFVPMLYIKDGMSSDRNINLISFIIYFNLVLFGGTGVNNYIVMALSFLVFTYLYIMLYKKHKSLFIILMFNCLYMVLLFLLIVKISSYFLALSLSIIFSIILSLGKDISLNTKFSIPLILVALLSLPYVFHSYYFEYNYNYSSAFETSNYINNTFSKDTSFLCLHDAHCSSIIPYVSNTFYSAKSLKSYTYVIWNREREQDYDLNKIKKIIEKGIYYISIKDDEEEKEFLKGLKKDYIIKAIYNSKNSLIADEVFVIYKIDKRS